MSCNSQHHTPGVPTSIGGTTSANYGSGFPMSCLEAIVDPHVKLVHLARLFQRRRELVGEAFAVVRAPARAESLLPRLLQFYSECLRMARSSRWRSAPQPPSRPAESVDKVERRKRRSIA